MIPLNIMYGQLVWCMKPVVIGIHKLQTGQIVCQRTNERTREFLYIMYISPTCLIRGYKYTAVAHYRFWCIQFTVYPLYRWPLFSVSMSIRRLLSHNYVEWSCGTTTAASLFKIYIINHQLLRKRRTRIRKSRISEGRTKTHINMAAKFKNCCLFAVIKLSNHIF